MVASEYLLLPAADMTLTYTHCRCSLWQSIPWWLFALRIVLFGAPSDSSTRDALTQAAQDIYKLLTGQHKASDPAAAVCCGSLQALLQVVMWGAASLTANELLCAIRQLLQFAGQPADDAMATELARQIRQVQRCMCRGPTCMLHSRDVRYSTEC